MLYRKIKPQIMNWIENGKKALLVTGARQIGKTYLIRECLKESGVGYIEVNFIENPELVEVFSENATVEEILFRLSMVYGNKLNGVKVIFFDEVQENKEIATKIKFLVEDGTFKYIMSGSLLGVELEDISSAPVGYMDTLNMYPMDLMEFFIAIGMSDEALGRIRENYEKREPVDEFAHNRLMDAFYTYLIIGGMPEAVQKYIDTNDMAQVSNVHKNIIKLYKLDFTKYEKIQKLLLREIYDRIPGELNAPNKRFMLNKLGKGMSYDRAENSFLWLKDAGAALPTYNVTEASAPLKSSEKRNLFKLFLSDVGLLTSYYSDSVKLSIIKKDKNINNGALFENVVAQELASKGFSLYYYNNKQKGEVDFVIEKDGEVLPLEVKSGKDYKIHSALNNLLDEKKSKIKEAFILGNSNVETSEKRIYLPIYMIMFLENSVTVGKVKKIDLSDL
ncbi:MAG: DUF4143 domain-containing protein [Parasporobacterium sp.]|nr:DUF4143 domain-containing protein [Parasporobacterium sp.]